jgi:3'(2'), 5'-bisphosphate nucleotidase
MSPDFSVFPLSSTHISAVIQIAQKAGQIILALYKKSLANEITLQVILKPNHTPVTRVDIDAHEYITQQLKKLTPDIPVVSEEDPVPISHPGETNTFWLVDPLDGTKAFLKGSSEFTVNIALVHHTRAVFGVIVAPALNLTYWGGLGLGTFCQTNQEPEIITVKNPDASVKVITSKNHLNPETKEFLKKLPFADYLFLKASSSLKFCRIAEGFAHLYPRLGPTCEWDTAAGQAILEAAGGYVLTLDGEPLRYGKTDILNPYFVASSMLL